MSFCDWLLVLFVAVCVCVLCVCVCVCFFFTTNLFPMIQVRCDSHFHQWICTIDGCQRQTFEQTSWSIRTSKVVGVVSLGQKCEVCQTSHIDAIHASCTAIERDVIGMHSMHHSYHWEVVEWSVFAKSQCVTMQPIQTRIPNQNHEWRCSVSMPKSLRGQN